MCWVNFVVVVESIQALITQKDDRQFHLPSIIAVASALGMLNLIYCCVVTCVKRGRLSVVKFFLFLYSYSLRNKSSQVRMLWQDHRNDLFINGFGTPITSYGIIWASSEQNPCIMLISRYSHVLCWEQISVVYDYFLKNENKIIKL